MMFTVVRSTTASVVDGRTRSLQMEGGIVRCSDSQREMGAANPPLWERGSIR